MAQKEKRMFIDMVGRLSWETQLHLDERQHHFHINKIIVVIISVILIVLAGINVYYVAVLYQDLNGIVNNMDSMHGNMKKVSKRMIHITDNVKEFEHYMRRMDNIVHNTGEMAGMMPSISSSMHQMEADITVMDADMGRMATGMSHVDQRFQHMTQGVAVMRVHVREIARPMGSLNPFMP
ncbi:translation initiation factor 2 [Thiolapillus sp.]